MILEFMYRTKTALRDWALRHAHGPHAVLWLFALAVAESSFFPIPPDVLLAAILLAGSERYLYYSAVTTAGSVTGGVIGYLVGLALFDVVGRPIVSFYGLESEVARVAGLFSDNAFWAVFISAFTPVPYKVFTIAAGLFRINFGVFILASLLGRGLRFFAEGAILRAFGDRLGALAYRYFNLFTLIVAIIGIAVAFVLIY